MAVRHECEGLEAPAQSLASDALERHPSLYGVLLRAVLRSRAFASERAETPASPAKYGTRLLRNRPRFSRSARRQVVGAVSVTEGT